MGLTMGADGEWVTDERGLAQPEHPDYIFSYLPEEKYCQYKWTDEEYASLAKMYPPAGQLLTPDGALMDDVYQPLGVILRKFVTHKTIISLILYKLKRATRLGYGHALGIYVLLYQLPPEYLPLYIEGEKDIQLIAQWRLQHATR